MTSGDGNFEMRYRRALAACIDHKPVEADLATALELGRSALAEGRSLIDLLSMHNSMLAALIGRAAKAAEVKRRYDRAEEFLTQVIVPFESVNRGGQEIISRLRRSNEILERQVTERTAALHQSEERFRDIAEVSGDWIWESGIDHRFSFFAGQSVQNMARVGISPETAIGKTRWELAGVDPEKDDVWNRHKADLDAHRPFQQFRYSLDTPAGVRRYFSVSGKPVFDETGGFRGYRGTASDETKMVEALERAERVEALLRDAIDSMAEGFVLFDREDRFLLCNEAYDRLFPESAGLPRLGMRFEDILRDRISKGHVVVEPGREEEWIAERLRRHQAVDAPFEQQLLSGRWMLVTERRMRNGGIAGLRVDITALKVAQIALRDSEERLDRAQAIAGIGSWELETETGRITWSKEMHKILKLAPGEFVPTLDTLAPNLHPEEVDKWRAWLDQLKAGHDAPALEYHIRRPDGVVRIVSAEGRPIADGSDRATKIAGTLQDVTERRFTERQLVQSQKMDAIGNLTGGMAHDFNNLLAIIIGNLDLLQNVVAANPEAAELSKAALDAALRGADLTRRLLAFARRQPLQTKQIDVNQLVVGLAKLFGRTLGEDIEVELNLAPNLWFAAADPAQLEAAIINLATNARDAMPKGGRLTIATRNAHLDDDYVARHTEVAAGDYIAIEVSDTGAGIPPELLSRIFEPFFTTKETGKGTGLGLSMVFGFMKQSGGHINVYSELGIGTAFRLYLPRGRQRVTEGAQLALDRAAERGDETILVVEDNAQLRRVVVKQLEDAGYRVVEAENAAAALAVLESNDAIALLLTDIVMPGGMDGRDLARAATARRPGLKVLLTSGFPEARFNGDDKLALAVRLLSKPYRKDDLMRMVREVIDG